MAWWRCRLGLYASTLLGALGAPACSLDLAPIACLVDRDCTEVGQLCVGGTCQVTSDPTIAITSPESGVLNSNSAIIEVAVRNFTLDEAAIGGDPVAGHGPLTRLAVQTNTVRVVLAENDHSELGYLDEVVLDVRPESRALVITSPDVPAVSKLEVPVGTTIPVVVRIDNFELDPAAVAGDPDPCLCRGHMHLYVSDPLRPDSRAWQGAYAETQFELDPGELHLQDGASLGPGTTYVLELRLSENDHTEIEPPVFDFFRLELTEPTEELTGSGEGTQ
jgi:hypothetical protein